MSKHVSGALMPVGIGVEIQPVFVGEYTHIQSLVGGPFDVVTRTMADGEIIVGYCHDEGLILDLEQNWFASAFFERDLRGPVVIVGGTSPSGEYDGDNHDISDQFLNFLMGKFTKHVAECYNESVMVTLGIQLAQGFGIVDKAEMAQLQRQLRDVVENGADDEELRNHIMDIGTRAKQFVEDKTVESSNIADEVEEFLKSQES